MAAVNDIVQITVRHVLSGVEDQINTFHFRVATVPTPNDVPTILADFGPAMGQFYAEFAAHMPSALVAVDLSYRNITADGPTSQTSDFDGYTGGTGISDYLPPHDTMLVLFRTGVKRRTGRCYLPVMLESSQDGGIWNAGTIDDVASALPLFTNVLGGGSGGEYTPIVYSPTDGVGYPIQGWQIRPLAASLNSRKRGRGS